MANSTSFFKFNVVFMLVVLGIPLEASLPRISVDPVLTDI